MSIVHKCHLDHALVTQVLWLTAVKWASKDKQMTCRFKSGKCPVSAFGGFYALDLESKVSHHMKGVLQYGIQDKYLHHGFEHKLPQAAPGATAAGSGSQ